MVCLLLKAFEEYINKFQIITLLIFFVWTQFITQKIQAASAILSIVQDEENVFALSDTSVTMIPSDFDCGKPTTCQ